MRAHDKKKFVEEMVKEVEDDVRRNHWEIVPIQAVHKGHRVLDAVWSFKQKRDIVSQRVTKWKARLTAHGGLQEKRENYWETYTPVVNWFSIRLLLALSLINK